MPIRRIAVAVDASPTSLAALEATASLAAHGAEELLGLFVEDINVVRWASLPFARELGSFSATGHPIDSAAVERRLKQEANRVRNAIMRVAQQCACRSSFRVVRGRVGEEVLAASFDADLLIVGKTGWSAGARSLGSTARILTHQANTHVLFVKQPSSPKGPVVVVYEGSLPGRLGLSTALDIAGGSRRETIVLVVAEEHARYQELVAEVRSTVGAHIGDVQCRHLMLRNAGKIADTVASLHASLVVVPRGTTTLSSDFIERLTAEFSGPVLIAGVARQHRAGRVRLRQ